MSNQFFTPNHALTQQTSTSSIAGRQQPLYPLSGTTHSGTGPSAQDSAYSPLPDFDLGDSASEVGSTTSRGDGHSTVGRPRKRSRASEAGGLSPDTNMDAKAGRKSTGAASKPSQPKSKGKGKADAAVSATDGDKKAKPRQKRTGEKKKKAGRACAACQKAHLTCDDARPCARCVKKGCADTCHDGARKKAKYLMEVPDELLERRPPNNHANSGDSIPPERQEPSPMMTENSPSSPGTLVPPQMPLPQPSPQNQPPTQAFNFDSMPFAYDGSFGNEFGSEAANLEYAILSTMLNGNGFSLDNYNQTPSDPRLNGNANGSTMLVNSPLSGTLTLGGAASMAPTSTNGYVSTFRAGPSTQTSPVDAHAFGMSPRLQDSVQNLFAPAPTVPKIEEGSAFGQTTQQGGTSGEVFGPNLDHFAASAAGGTASTARPVANNGAMTADEAYAVTKPYNYAQSYHYLIKHLKSRFEKNDILRIIRALATFRPSLIALQMPLTERDEIFIERTFQRTLVELNKLISFSGTPTVVWRRTGEVCLVGTEFCLLTGWKRDELLGKKYIFELLDTASVVDLYEAFAKHAFESTSSSVTMQCVVLGPTGKPVPCAFCFSIRRDLFSCPSLVVGSFLPILT